MEKKRPFSKLKKQIDALFVPELKMHFCCTAYPIRGQWKSNNSIPRYYLKLGKEIIWDYPKDIFKSSIVEIWGFGRNNGLSELVREYIDTPVDKLLLKKFKADKWECICQYVGMNYQETIGFNYKLTELFKAGDRRLGKEKLLAWAANVKNPIVDRILDRRFKTV